MITLNEGYLYHVDYFGRESFIFSKAKKKKKKKKKNRKKIKKINKSN